MSIATVSINPSLFTLVATVLLSKVKSPLALKGFLLYILADLTPEGVIIKLALSYKLIYASISFSVFFITCSIPSTTPPSL